MVSTSNAAEPATIYYTTNGADPSTMGVEAYIKAQNPYCPEWLKSFLPYDKLKMGDKKNCKRYRPWVCSVTRSEGVDIEQLPLSFCVQDK